MTCREEKLAVNSSLRVFLNNAAQLDYMFSAAFIAARIPGFHQTRVALSYQSVDSAPLR